MPEMESGIVQHLPGVIQADITILKWTWMPDFVTTKLR